MSIEQDVARHYTHGALERTILDALRAAGKDPDKLAPADLAPVEEFHIGGRPATIELAAQLGLRPGLELLDVGSGIGGPARHFALAQGCRVTGIDLTDEYVEVANALTRRLGLADRVTFRQASALALPFPPASFDGAYMLHVGMNIQDKAALMAAVRGVLRPSGWFGIYDVMRIAEGDLTYPLPWSATPDTSFVETPATYRRHLEAAGFRITHERDRRAAGIEFFQRMRAAGGPPPLGLHLVVGPGFQQRFGNLITALQQGLLAPTEMVVRLG